MSFWDDAKDIMDLSFIENGAREDSDDTIHGWIVLGTGSTDSDHNSFEEEMVQNFEIVSCVSCGDRGEMLDVEFTGKDIDGFYQIIPWDSEKQPSWPFHLHRESFEDFCDEFFSGRHGFPPLLMDASSFIRPSAMASGRGGQPGI
jgi:hypothetical protein